MKVLLAEDEVELASAETTILKMNGYEVDNAYDGEKAEEMILHHPYDVIVLDIMMPLKDGVEVLKDIRKAGCTTPVIMLTAKAEVDDRITGLDAGADDYLTKPFSMKELLARIRSQTRRSSSFTPSVLNYKNLELDVSEQMLKSRNTIRLSARETKLLSYLIQNQGRELSTEDILSHVWSDETDADPEAVYFYVSYLREKLKAVGSEVRIIGEKNGFYHLGQENDL